VINKEHIVTHWNKACEALTGISAGEMIGTRKHWAAFYAAERPLMADLIVENASKEEIAVYYPTRIRESVLTEGAYEVEDLFQGLEKQADGSSLRLLH